MLRSPRFVCRKDIQGIPVKLKTAFLELIEQVLVILGGTTILVECSEK